MSEIAPEEKPKVVDIKGNAIVPLTTPVAIIEILEATLASAKAGHMSAIGIATVAADRLASTVGWADTGFGQDLIAAVDVLHYRRLKILMEDD